MACSSQPYGGPEIMVFRPTMQEFQDFSAYIKKMEDSGAHRFGIAKVIPPKEWYATKNYDMEKIGKMVIDSPIAQLVTGQQGLYQQYNIQQKPLTVKELKDLAESDKYCPPDGDFEKLERAYWKNITFNPPIYGADVAGSIYDKDVKCWNINHLNTILDLIENERKVKILGVNTAYLYFGMWKTAFAWHTEDMDLYSINYLHFGAPKSWYAIPPEHGKRLETLAAGFFPGSAQTCSQFLRHKMTVISPLMLKKYSIPFYKITQNAGEFMITFPYGYHAGFNQGFNCAESTNFASLRWIDFGKKAKPCTCRSDNVKIEMGLFVKKYQPKQYKEYLESREKRKASSNEQSEEEKKANSKKQENKIKVKRYPAISAVKSIVKAAKKENSEDTSNYKKQRQRAIEKAKNLIKKAEKARRVSSEKKSLQDELPSQKQGGNEARTLEKALKATNDRQMTKDPDAVTGNTGPAAILTQAHFQSEEERRRQRELKLLEIKAEMEREIEERKNKLKNIKIARARRHELRDMKQKLRTRDRATSRPRKVSENKETVETKTKSTPIIAERKAHPSVIKGKEWTSTLSGLWVDEIPSFQREQAYNRRLCKNGHGCAVCAYFDHGLARTMHENESEAASNHQQTLASPLSTTPLVPVTCFMRPELNSTGIPSSETRPVVLPSMMNKESRLVTCTSCLVTVHEKCYGIDETMSSYENNWYCEPCRTNLDLQSRCGIRCEMCPIRGGALKPTTDGRWAHIVCAIAFFDVTFTDVQKRGLIELGSLNNARTKLKCAYCHRSSSDEMNNGACVQCVAGKCAHSFHVTCSFQNGVPLYSGDWPLPLEVYCHQHVKTRSSRGEKRLLAEIQENDFVFAKHKNGRFYKGRVESIESTLFYYVVFEDGSFCHDLPPEDIVNHQPGMLYSKEEKVDVLWTDGIVYPSIIKSHEIILKYEVVFEDGSVLLLKRNDVYREDEELPRKIRAKLSHATETANLLWKASSIRESPTKRARIENKKFAKLL